MPYNLLERFKTLKHDPRTGGELTVTTGTAPSEAVRIPNRHRNSWWPNPYSAQEVVTSLCETIHAVQAQNRALADRLAALEQGKFATSGQPATLTVTVQGGHSQAPAPTRPQPRGVRPCPMVQARAGNAPDAGYSENANDCPLASGHNGGFGAW